jgi:hypothetical protein
MCGISFTLHGWRPSSFFRVADRWDARLMTAVCWFVGSLSRLVILDTCPRIDFFANLSIGYLCFVGRMFPLIIHVCMVVACLGICYYFFGQIVHVCIFTCGSPALLLLIYNTLLHFDKKKSMFYSSVNLNLIWQFSLTKAKIGVAVELTWDPFWRPPLTKTKNLCL